MTDELSDMSDALEEEWRPILGYEGVYEVSSLGRIRSLSRNDPQGRFHKGQIRSLKTDRYGYQQIHLCLNGARDWYTVHKLVALAFLPDRPSEDHEINHINGDKTDNRPENLEWVTPQENVDHAIANGFYNPSKHGKKGGNSRSIWHRGEDKARSKLTAEAVRYSRCEYAVTGISQRRLAEIWGCHQTTMSKAIRNEKWSHVHVIERADHD